ncbi:MAG: hypothetical protein HY774_00940 [Acidobacteria bacterium]|nr:hypothetical protein [Acidobacteriota bacterium]
MRKAILLTLLIFAGTLFLISYSKPWLQRTVAAQSKQKVPTFNKEIVRIFQKNCQVCHHPNYIAPFSLMTYDEAKPWAQAIKAETQAKRMPPWKAASGCGSFNDERVLSAEDIDLIARWADAGAPEGKAKHLPPPVNFSSDWLLGKPELELASPEAFSIPASGDDIYQCFVLPHKFDQEAFLTASEILPDAAEVVHHVLLFVDTSGEAERLDADDPAPGYTSFGGPGFIPAALLGGWAPGNFPRFTPKGIGVKIPKNSRIVMQVHYHPNGTAFTDRTRLGLHFAKEPVETELQVLPVVNPFFKIPAGAPSHEVKAVMTVPFFWNIKVLGITPHMHLLGKSIQVEARLPGGEKICLVNIPTWDFRWQGTYAFKEPITLPGGTIITATAIYDNSMANPLNPNNPPKQVEWGEQTTDEMCLVFMNYVSAWTDKSPNQKARYQEVDPIQAMIADQPPIKMGGVDIMQQAKLKMASSLLFSSPVEMYNWADAFRPEVSKSKTLPWQKYFGKDGAVSKKPACCH